MARASSKNAHKVKHNIPAVRGPFDRVRTAVCFDPEKGLTHQSFKDECDINRIVETYARTGIVPARRMEPIYGDAPEATLFEAACAQAAIRTAEEDGFEYPDESSQTASEAAGDEIDPTPRDTPRETGESPSAGSHEPANAADG